MPTVDGKKPKWVGHIHYIGGISITQNVFSSDVIAFVKSQNQKFATGPNKMHAYVFPYMLSEAKKQRYELLDIEIREL